jgi:YjbE family integral membrane protein
VSVIHWGALAALLSVVLIDLALAGDNAIVVGVAVSNLPRELRRRALILGIAAATLLRIALSAIALRLLAVIGLTLAGGLLLLWVVWKLYRDWRAGEAAHHPATSRAVTLSTAIFRLVVADISMSLDNVLAVAGAARGHFVILVIGLLLSVALMGLASTILVRLMERQRWIVPLGLVVVAAVALRMIYDGGAQVWAGLGW